MNFYFCDQHKAGIHKICLLLAITGIVSACTQHPAPPATVVHFQAPADFPETYYRQAAASNSKILRVDSNRSLVTILVRRGGVLSHLGHDHVVASHDVTGYVDTTSGRADLYVPLERLAVDEPELRSEAGLTTQLSPEAIDGTRRNMLDKVLESEQFAFALIRITRVASARSTLNVTIKLHNSVQRFEVPAQIETIPGGLNISGQLTFNQTDFGITPFSILGGALQVLDHLDLRFKIIATDS